MFSLTGLQKSFCVIGVEIDWFPPIIDRSNASNLSKNSDKQYHFTEMKKYHKKGYHHSFYVLFSNAISYSQPLLSEWSVGQDGKSAVAQKTQSSNLCLYHQWSGEPVLLNPYIQKLTFGNQSKNIQIIALWASPTTSVSFKVKKNPFSIFPVNLSLVKALTRWANLLKDVFLEGQCPFSQIYSALWTIWFRLHIIIICKIIQIIRREVGLCV